MVNAVVRWGNNYLLQKSHAVDVTGMVPKLHEQMDGCYNAYNRSGHANNGHGQIKNGEEGYEIRERLAQGAGQVKLLAAVLMMWLFQKKLTLCSMRCTQ